MPWAAAAAVAGAVIGSSGAKSAAKTQGDSTKYAADLQYQAQQDALEAQKPFLDAGYAGVNRLQELLGIGGNANAAGYGSLNELFKFDGSDLASDPGYQFQLQQGENALSRKAAAGGGFYSGEALRDASTYNQGLASTAFNDAYTRQYDAFQTSRTNQLNPLQSLAGQGQSSANASGNILSNGANSLASLYTNNANAQGASSIAQANALTNGLNQGMTAWQRAQMMGGQQQGVGSGSTWFNDPTDAGGYNATNGSDAGFYISDRRLKTNIVQIGQTEAGNNVYRWDWIHGGSGEGVIAQEVQHIPGAVIEGDDGFLRVDYRKV